MQSVNGAQFLNTTSLSLLSRLFPACASIVIVHLNIEVLNLIGLLVLYAPNAFSFISTQFEF